MMDFLESSLSVDRLQSPSAFQWTPAGRQDSTLASPLRASSQLQCHLQLKGQSRAASSDGPAPSRLGNPVRGAIESLDSSPQSVLEAAARRGPWGEEPSSRASSGQPSSGLAPAYPPGEMFAATAAAFSPGKGTTSPWQRVRPGIHPANLRQLHLQLHPQLDSLSPLIGSPLASSPPTSCASPDSPIPKPSEDIANDDVIATYLVRTASAAARAPRERARPASQKQPLSQQLLDGEVTRRDRRASCDSAVCEMRPRVDALRGKDILAARQSARALRTALKDAPENRMRLVAAGGVLPLLYACASYDQETSENATAAVLHLSLAWDSTVEVMGCGGVRILVGILALPSTYTESARSNAAASLFALSRSEEHQKLVLAAGALPLLAQLLQEASSKRTKKDACLALYNLCQMPKGTEEAVTHHVPQRALELLEEAEEGVEEKAAALLSVIVRHPSGRSSLISEEEDVLTALVDTLEAGSSGAAQHAASALLNLTTAQPRLVPRLLSEGCLPPLVRLAEQSRKGSDSRALLHILREHCAARAKAEAAARVEAAAAAAAAALAQQRKSQSLPRIEKGSRTPRLSLVLDSRRRSFQAMRTPECN